MSYNKEHYAKLGAVEALAQKTKEELDALEGNFGDKNVIEEIDVNGVKQSVEEKKVNIKVPTKLGELENDKSYQTEEQVNAKISSVYKPAGSSDFSSLPEPGGENVGNVYNVTDKFNTDTRFVEGAGKEYPAGTNVVVVNSDGYKYDVLSGMVDFTPYAKQADVTSGLAGKADKVHTHEYAGSDSVGGAANEAAKLTTETAGNAIIPAYFADGVPKACTHKLEKDVPASAVFTDTTYDDASTDEHGLMSTKDKSKLDGIEAASDEEVSEMISTIFTV